MKNKESKELSDVMDNLQVDCLSPGAGRLDRQNRRVVCEAPLTIDIKDVGTYTLMCTPCDELALAVGFAFTEGLITSRRDINVMMKCPDDPHVIRMQLAHAKNAGNRQRNLLIVSSCGICGSEDMDALLKALPVAGNTLRVTGPAMAEMPERLRQQQEIFDLTGGTHAVGLFRNGQIIATGEDLGRHNAFDKAIGKCVLQGTATAGTAAALSGRVSLEMVVKAAQAGIELLAAVSAPSSLAIEAAQKSNITLCGFVRAGAATIYCHPQRIAE